MSDTNNLKVEYLSVDALEPYGNNARRHEDDDLAAIQASIRDFGFNDPIGIWSDHNVIVEGHGRLMAAKALGMTEVPCIRLDHLTDEQRRAYALAHNKTAELSDWDFDLLETELADIYDVDMAELGFDVDGDTETEYMERYADGKEVGSLAERYVVPPFSVLDGRQGYWNDRKRAWNEKIGDASESRDGEFGKITESALFTQINGGTSNFDPVLAETMFKWFCIPGGKVLDPFGGEQTKGVVAGVLGLHYRGCEIREEQCEINRAKTAEYADVQYFCGDSNNISEIIPDRDFDMCFTSPPYYDLEVYSKTDMSALGTYEEFMAQYRNIFEQCYSMLRDGAFCVVKVGEIRDKSSGEYRCFVADNIKLLCDIGFKFYNDIVLVNPIGTAAIRANKMMQTRKVVKTHQNVLVFYKGDPAKISKEYPVIDFDGIDTGEESADAE